MTEIPEEIKKRLLDYPFVTAVGAGEGRGERHKNGAEAVVAFVRRKKAESDLDDDDVLPKQIDGWKVDVQEIGKVEIEAQALKDTGEIDTTDRHRPNPQGVSIGHPDVTAGTAGFIAWAEKEKYGVTYAAPRGVTNNHVGADVNSGEVGDPILQPGPLDGGGSSDRIGSLRGYVELEDENNFVDVAWYSIDDRSSNSFIPSVGVPRETTEVERGDEVRKFGRTTGLRSGAVRSSDARIRVSFGDGTKEFVDQVICEDISTGGDSGSAVVSGDGKLAGLLFAGSDQITVFNKIQNVLDETGLHLKPNEVYN